MISECIDLSYSIEIDPERLGKFVDEYVGKDVDKDSDSNEDESSVAASLD